jgi:hypothetical protein
MITLWPIYRLFNRVFAGFLLFLLVDYCYAQSYVSGEDESYYKSYQDGWQSGDKSGRGFQEWILQAPQYDSAEEEQYAGFFIAESNRESDLGSFASKGKAFGIFANGTSFEETVAFRAFDRPLGVGDVFSFRFKFSGFLNKFERDSDKLSSVGFALRHTVEAYASSSIAKSRVFAFVILEGFSTYQIFDGSKRFNTRIFIDPQGAEVGFRVNDSGYDIQIITLSDHTIYNLNNRSFAQLQLANEDQNLSPLALRGFAFFNLNGGANNAYFNALQLSSNE